MALQWAACFDVRERRVGCTREVAEGPLDGLPINVPGVGCDAGHLRVGVDVVDAARYSVCVRDWAHLACDWLLLDGWPVGVTRCLRERVRVGRICVCCLARQSRLRVAEDFELCRCTAFLRRHSPCFVWVFREGTRDLQAGREARGVGAWCSVPPDLESCSMHEGLSVR